MLDVGDLGTGATLTGRADEVLLEDGERLRLAAHLRLVHIFLDANLVVDRVLERVDRILRVCAVGIRMARMHCHRINRLYQLLLVRGMRVLALLLSARSRNRPGPVLLVPLPVVHVVVACVGGRLLAGARGAFLVFDADGFSVL